MEFDLAALVRRLAVASARNFRSAVTRTICDRVCNADGNAKGGFFRLPHMTSALPDGRKAEAPLGQYTGFAFDYVTSNFFFTLSGTFRRMSSEKIRELYPRHAAYVDAITASTEDLVTKRYILPEAAEAYIEAAKRSDFGQP